MAPSNVLPLHGNEKTMNLNNMILTNIQASPYFKNNLYELKTYHEVLDEIYYKVSHLEPWEKNSRKTSGQTGMCGGVRGVGAGGIVSSAFCLLYKLYTLRLTRKQLNGLINHTDSPYIRGLGFMYIRYTQPPADFWDWYEPYLDDEESWYEVDVKAGGGAVMTVGAMVRSMMCKLEWWSTLFPRIPVPIQKKIETNLRERAEAKKAEMEMSRAVQQHLNNAQAPTTVAAEFTVLEPEPERHNSRCSDRPYEQDKRSDRGQRSTSSDHHSQKRSRSADRHPPRDKERRYQGDGARDMERHQSRGSNGRSRDDDSRSRDYEKRPRNDDSRSRDYYDKRSRNDDSRSRDYEKRSRNDDNRARDQSRDHDKKSREDHDNRPGDRERRSRDFDAKNSDIKSRDDRKARDYVVKSRDDAKPRDHEKRPRDDDGKFHESKVRDTEKRSRDEDHKHRHNSSKHKKHKHSRSRSRERHRESHDKRSRSRDRGNGRRETSFERDLRRERERQRTLSG